MIYSLSCCLLCNSLPSSLASKVYSQSIMMKKITKKVKPTTVQNKRNSSNKDSIDKEDNDRIPGLQLRNRPDSSNEDDDEYNRSDNEGHLVTEK